MRESFVCGGTRVQGGSRIDLVHSKNVERVPGSRAGVHKVTSAFDAAVHGPSGPDSLLERQDFPLRISELRLQ